MDNNSQTKVADNPNFRRKPLWEFVDGKHEFVIPSYQRGYRWSKKQVIDLLDDIRQFSENQEDDSYYLQPLVVKPFKTKEGVVEPNKWEVLDGQQRLTTMLLILKKLLKKMSQDDAEFFANRLYTLQYTNRPQLDFDKPNPSENIDSFYLAESINVINKWFDERKAERKSLNNMIECLFYDGPQKVYFIWYVVDESEEEIKSIQIFNRLNKGKIALTSSELIKALFIRNLDTKSNIQGEPKITAPSEQLSITWNEIERYFQNDKFWYFISNDNGKCQTRIDLLFDYLTEKPADNEDGDYAYRKFQNLYDYEKTKDISKLDNLWRSMEVYELKQAWEKTIKTFNDMEAWFEDNMFYHYIGFLIAEGSRPLDIYNKLSMAKKKAKDECPGKEWTREDNERELRKLIMDKFMLKKQYLTTSDIDGLEYGSEFVSKVLLLFNVETCKNTQSLRFDFSHYKQENWDVEHINPQNEVTIVQKDDRMQWLRIVKDLLDREKRMSKDNTVAGKLLERVNKMINDYEKAGETKRQEYLDFYREINQYFEFEEKDGSIENVDLTAKNNDNISNLTLLDSVTNRSYQDSPYPHKRQCVIDVDKEGKRFMPPCTRNVFLKYYTDADSETSALDAMRWNESDRRCYLHNIHEVLDVIFNTVNNENGAE